MSLTSATPRPQSAQANETAEWSLLLAFCSIRSDEEKIAFLRARRGDIEWKHLFQLADRHNVRPLLYPVLSKAEELVPSENLKVLKQLHQTNVHRSLLLARELIHVTDRLTEAGIEVLPYKGLAIAEAVYGDIALRQAGDIDLLVRPRDFLIVRESLKELGYVPHLTFSKTEERAYLKSGYECAFDGPAGPNLVEVQWAVQPRFYAVELDQEALFQRAVPLKVAGHSMRTLSMEDLFIVLALHAAKHVWGRLIWLCDLARIIRIPTVNWNWIGKQSKDLGVARILRVTLQLLDRLLNASTPAAADIALAPDPDATALATEIQNYLEHGEAFEVESFAYFRLMARLRENAADRVRLASRLAFTPGPGEWKTIRLPEPLFPLYILVRFYRLAGRLIGA